MTDAVVSTPVDRRSRWLEMYEQNTELPMMVLAVSVIPLLLVEWFADLNAKADQSLYVTYWVIWVAFLLDYLVRLLLASSRRAYVRKVWFELLVVVLTFPLPFTVSDPLEILRSARAARLLRVLRFGAVAARGAKRIVRLPRSSNSQLAVGVGTFLLLALISSVLVLAVEEGHRGSQINTMGDAVWWAVATVTTIGYGDVVPQMWFGRVMAFVLMLAGVGLVGVVVSNLSGRLMTGVERRVGRAAASAEEEAIAGVVAKLDELNERLARIEARLPG
jgi:voltage-gated potassium channel